MYMKISVYFVSLLLFLVLWQDNLQFLLLVSLNSERVVALKYLFGIWDDMTRSVGFPEENIKYILQFSALLNSKAAMDDCLVTSYSQIPLHQVSSHLNLASSLVVFTCITL